METREQIVKRQQDFKKSLESKTKEELEALEKEIMTEAEALDKELSNTTFKLHKDGYEDASKAIRYFLNKQSLKWQYVQSMMNLWDFWAPVMQKELPYPILHATLTTLGDLDFTGADEWAKVLLINKYFEKFRERYVELVQKPYDVADRHSMVMDALGLQNPIELPSEA